LAPRITVDCRGGAWDLAEFFDLLASDFLSNSYIEWSDNMRDEAFRQVEREYGVILTERVTASLSEKIRMSRGERASSTAWVRLPSPGQ
jgi:hypothetical protein